MFELQVVQKKTVKVVSGLHEVVMWFSFNIYLTSDKLHDYVFNTLLGEEPYAVASAGLSKHTVRIFQ